MEGFLSQTRTRWLCCYHKQAMIAGLVDVIKKANFGLHSFNQQNTSNAKELWAYVGKTARLKREGIHITRNLFVGTEGRGKNNKGHARREKNT